MMTDAAEFLAKALDAAEDTARLAIPMSGTGDWQSLHRPGSHGIGDVWDDEICIYDEGGHTADQAAHIAANDPARVLRVIAAHRKLLEMHVEYVTQRGFAQGVCEACDPEGSTVVVGWPCPTIELLAEAYGWTADD